MFINIALADTINTQGLESTTDAILPTFESVLSSLVPMLLIFLVFYFLLIRPQEKKRRSQEILISGVKKGEEVLTNAGIYGFVTRVDNSNNIAMLRIAENVEIKILKNTITDIISRTKTTDTKLKAKNRDKKKITKNNVLTN